MPIYKGKVYPYTKAGLAAFTKAILAAKATPVLAPSKPTKFQRDIEKWKAAGSPIKKVPPRPKPFVPNSPKSGTRSYQ